MPSAVLRMASKLESGQRVSLVPGNSVGKVISGPGVAAVPGVGLVTATPYRAWWVVAWSSSSAS